MIMFWSGGYDEFDSHYVDVNVSPPTSHSLHLITKHRERIFYSINERDKQFLHGLFNVSRTPVGERVAIVLGRNYLEHQSKVHPVLYSQARATNDLTYVFAFARMGLLKFHVPIAPVTHWGIFIREKQFGAIKEVKDGMVWLIDPLLKAGMCPQDGWRKIIKEPARLSIDVKNNPELNEP